MEKTEKKTDKKVQNILVVYYSRTGVTRKVAEQIAKQLGVDIEEIIDMKKRSGICGFITGGRDALKRKETEINEMKKDPSQYDLMIVGSPVWAGNIAPAVRTYLNRYKTGIRSLAFFATSGGTTQEKAFKEVEGLLGKELISLMGMCTKEFKDNSVFDAKLSSFIEGIGQAKKKD